MPEALESSIEISNTKVHLKNALFKLQTTPKWDNASKVWEYYLRNTEGVIRWQYISYCWWAYSNECNYLSRMWIKLIHVSKRSPRKMCISQIINLVWLIQRCRKPNLLLIKPIDTAPPRLKIRHFQPEIKHQFYERNYVMYSAFTENPTYESNTFIHMIYGEWCGIFT